MRQPRKLGQLTGYSLQARDGEIGRLDEIYFDDRRWGVRYFVVRTGGWLDRRQVLVVPSVVTGIDEAAEAMVVDLSRDQVRNCPPMDTRLPVSRHYEREYFRYYGWEPYWEADPLFGALPTMTPPLEAGATAEPEHPHLRSSAEVRGYRIDASDGEIGHVEDFILEDPGWKLRYLEIDTRNWLPGKHVLIDPAWIRQVDWARQVVVADLTREAIQSAPPYDPSQVISREYQVALYQHYGMQFDED